MLEKKITRNLKVKKVSIVGVIPSFAFQRAKHCALELHRKLPQRFPSPEIIGLLDLDWNEKLQKWRQTLGREFWCLRRPVAVFFDGKFVGSDIELIKMVTLGDILMENIPRKNLAYMKEHFRKDYVTYLRKSKRIYCYLDICVDGSYVGTLTFQLYSDLLPRTCENFKCLCLGSRGPLLSYRGSRIHRIVKGGWLQGGDIQYKTGGGGFSIFCDPLEDECYGISHDRRGVLSMASKGRHWNGSQFFITLNPTTWMDTNFVAFGQLMEGARVLKLIENIETMYECPLQKIEIKSCGKLDLGDDEDVDATYQQELLPKKPPKIIENVGEQVVRLVMESLTEALARKERAADILHDGDIPSKMNIQMYFQGLYSIPDDVLEESAMYLRKLKRDMFRVLKPSATEIVEVLMYDLLMAVLTRMTTLDDVRETVGHDLYNKMLGRIDMEFEQCQKKYVKRLIDQIVSTAKSMISVVTKKVAKMKVMSTKIKFFRQKMQKWVQSFVLQETYKGENYHISDRPSWNVREKATEEEKAREVPKREGKPCCELEKKKESVTNILRSKYPPDDVCCVGSKLLDRGEIKLSDYFSKCRYDLKRIPKSEEDRMPLIDLIEISRFKLRWMRKKENTFRPRENVCMEKKVRKWMDEVVYIPETSWIKDLVFDKNEVVFDHMEEVLYGAMTAGLLEMYYFYDRYLQLCNKKMQKVIERVIYPEDYSEDTSTTGSLPKAEVEGEVEKVPELPKCTCGHPCCVCAFDPNFKAPTPPPSLEGEVPPESPSSTIPEPPPTVNPCDSDMELVDLNALIAEQSNMKPEEIDVRSFKWLKSYIKEKGCDLKTEFVTQVHKWMDGERFSCKGFISKHSMVTRASLLSLSISLTELITEENQTKAEIKNFIYDLWDLYFKEMFKEAELEYAQEDEEGEAEESVVEEEILSESDECKKIMADAPDFDFSKLCAKFGYDFDDGKKQPQGADGDEGKEDETEAVHVTRSEEEPKLGDVQDEDEAKGAQSNASLLEDEKEDVAKPKAVAPATAPQPETEKKAEDATQDTETIVKPEKIKKKKSPYTVRDVVEVSSGDESRQLNPYVLPFWVKFLTEMTKQALGNLAKVSRLPRRLYFLSDTDIDFDEKMKDWFEFNAFNPQPTKGREIMDYIVLHHKSLDNLEETARNYLKKKKYSELLNRCTRFTSAETVADEIVVDIIDNTMKDQMDRDTVELFVSNFISSAVASSKQDSESSLKSDRDQNETDKKERTSNSSDD